MQAMFGAAVCKATPTMPTNAPIWIAILLPSLSFNLYGTVSATTDLHEKRTHQEPAAAPKKHPPAKVDTTAALMESPGLWK